MHNNSYTWFLSFVPDCETLPGTRRDVNLYYGSSEATVLPYRPEPTCSWFSLSDDFRTDVLIRSRIVTQSNADATSASGDAISSRRQQDVREKIIDGGGAQKSSCEGAVAGQKLFVERPAEATRGVVDTVASSSSSSSSSLSLMTSAEANLRLKIVWFLEMARRSDNGQYAARYFIFLSDSVIHRTIQLRRQD
jgi:hypothetical protein